MLADLTAPLSSLQWLDRNSLSANNYNPNLVLERNLELLTQSILVNGFTQPIVATDKLVIIDGYHRWLVSGREPLLSKLQGKVPVVIVAHADPAEDVYGTITHNRARGSHQLGPMKSIVKNLLAQGRTIAELSRELGMRGEEIFRLSDFSREDFLNLMAEGVTAYSSAKLLVRT